MTEHADPMWRSLTALAATPESRQVVGMDEATGTIGFVDGQGHRPICFCGATNFRSCDETGAPLSVQGERRQVKRKRMGIETKTWVRVDWPGTFACDGCGRIVDGQTRRTISSWMEKK